MLRTTVNVARRSTGQARWIKPTANSIRVATPQRFYSGASMHDNDPEVLEREKHRNLRGEQHQTSTPLKHAPGWNESLATTSEAYTKADSDKSSTPIEVLQSETVEYTKKRHPPSTIAAAGEAVVEKVHEVVEEVKEVAAEAKDTIMGPLASAGKADKRKPEKTSSE